MTAVSHPRQAPRRRSLPRNCSWSEAWGSGSLIGLRILQDEIYSWADTKIL